MADAPCAFGTTWRISATTSLRRGTVPELHDLTVAQASERIAKRELSPVDLVEALLARIERLEPHLGAWARVTADVAREEAKAAQDEIERSGPKTPLHGIPVGLKDIIGYGRHPDGGRLGRT